MKELTQHIETELKKLDRGIVATPSEKYLQEFCDANHGQMDFLLMQMSKQYGYQLALQEILTFINQSEASD
tara:strand:+ start:534 stop:746 length:213 start_codon:yes stop_codon:yes gene_type:complete